MVLILGLVALVYLRFYPRGAFFFFLSFGLTFGLWLSIITTSRESGRCGTKVTRMVAEYLYSGRSIESHCFRHRLLPLGFPVPVMSYL